MGGDEGWRTGCEGVVMEEVDKGVAAWMRRRQAHAPETAAGHPPAVRRRHSGNAATEVSPAEELPLP